MERSGVEAFVAEMREIALAKPPPTQKDSSDEFSRCLKALFDETSLFPSRQKWAEVLSVPPKIIEDWIAGRKIPRPDRLWVLINILESHKINQVPLDRFRQMALKPATLVSIHGQWMLPTVDTYLKRRDFTDLFLEAETEVGQTAIGPIPPL